MGFCDGVEVSRLLSGCYVYPATVLVFRLIDAFADDISYALSWLVALPLEIVAASITMGFWEGARGINPCK